MSLLKERMCIEGTMPERAILRLHRAQIPLYNVKKKEKNSNSFYDKPKRY